MLQIVSMSPHLILVFQSLNQCQVVNLVFNTKKSHHPRKQWKQKNLRQKQEDRFCGSDTRLCCSTMDGLEQRNELLEWAINPTVGFDPTMYLPLDSYPYFIFQVCWWSISDTLSNLIEKRWSMVGFQLEHLREWLIYPVNFEGYPKIEFPKQFWEKLVSLKILIVYL